MTALFGDILAAALARATTVLQPLLAKGASGGDEGDAGSVEALGNAFSAIRHSVRTEERSSPVVLLIILAAALISASIYGAWRWQQRRAAQPSSRALLKRVCEQLNLPKGHRKLLWLLGTVAGLEPASALASPQLLTCLVTQAEQAGLHLSAGKTLQVGQILDVVSAASTASQ